jgi:hypothetical protein
MCVSSCRAGRRSVVVMASLLFVRQTEDWYDSVRNGEDLPKRFWTLVDRRVAKWVNKQGNGRTLPEGQVT